MTDCLLVGAGGALGAILRYLIGLLPVSPSNGFPVKTFLINIAGAFVIGAVAALAAKNAMNPKLVTFLKVGVCGGFTTFSSFALETEQLMEKEQGGAALAYVAASIVCGTAAVFVAGRLAG